MKNKMICIKNFQEMKVGDRIELINGNCFDYRNKWYFESGKLILNDSEGFPYVLNNIYFISMAEQRCLRLKKLLK